MSTPLLSIGMIVKNEERCLEKCLEALRPLREAIPCQLVIADTGSADATRDIAARYADVLFDFPWVNDFSAARNAVLDRCAGRWYLTVDADEYLDPDFHELTDFLTGPEAEWYDRAAVNQFNYQDLEMKGPGKDFLAVRMARMEGRPRYSGAIHETFSPVPAERLKFLPDVKLHHDGYASDPRDPDRFARKGERNLELLDAELEKRPQDLRRLLQCAESSTPFPVRHAGYVRQGMRALSQQRRQAEAAAWGPPLCRQALEAAALRMPELEDWYRWASHAFPDSMFLRLDGNFTLLSWCMRRERYDRVPALAEAYLSARRDFRERRFDLGELMHASLYHAARGDEAYVRGAAMEALSRLGRPEEAAELLSGEREWTELEPAEQKTLLTGCAWAADSRAVQSAVAEAAEAIRALPGKDGQKKWGGFLAVAGWLFQEREPGPDTPEAPWRMFRRVPGPLGLAARLMDAEGDEAAALAAQIGDWKDVPAAAAVRVARQGLPLPDAFYRQSAAALREVAAVLAAEKDPAALALDWTAGQDFGASLTKFQFLFDLTAAAIRTEGPWEENGRGGEMCGQFLSVAADLLPSLYSPELLADEADWTALPGLHQGALYALRAMACRAAGDALGAVRALRAALRAAPALKRPVALWTEEIRRESGLA